MQEKEERVEKERERERERESERENERKSHHEDSRGISHVSGCHVNSSKVNSSAQLNPAFAYKQKGGLT